MDVVLASSSPRRRDLLRLLALEPRLVDPGAIERAHEPGADPAFHAHEQALAKLRPTAALHPESLTIAADTIVLVDGRVLEKPRDAAQARGMLRGLSGRGHEVLTGLALGRRAHERSGVARTRVQFRELTDRDVQRYVESGEPLDKAGAYGLQGRGAALVRRVDGCPFNVVGLPLALLVDLLGQLGLRYDPGRGEVVEGGCG